MNPDWKNQLTQRGFRDGSADFGDQGAELAAARDGTVVVPLLDLGLIRASGEEAAQFLHNLLTNDVTHLPADGARLAGLCTAKGRLIATPLIWRQGADYLLALSADIHAGILKKLSMYVLRTKVKLTDATGELALIGLAGTGAAAAVAGIGAVSPEDMKTAGVDGGQVIALGGGRFLIAVEPAKAPGVWDALSRQARPAGLAAWQWTEIAAGMPRVVAATQEAFVPQMVNFEVVGGVSFTKGCYPGQEVVARAHYLGKVKRRMFRARLDAPAAPGTPLFSPDVPDQACGNVEAVAPSPDGGYECLAVIQEPCVEGGSVHLGALDGPPLSLLTLPYAIP